MKCDFRHGNATHVGQAGIGVLPMWNKRDGENQDISKGHSKMSEMDCSTSLEIGRCYFLRELATYLRNTIAETHE